MTCVSFSSVTICYTQGIKDFFLWVQRFQSMVAWFLILGQNACVVEVSGEVSSSYGGHVRKKRQGPGPRNNLQRHALASASQMSPPKLYITTQNLVGNQAKFMCFTQEPVRTFHSQTATSHIWIIQ